MITTKGKTRFKVTGDWLFQSRQLKSQFPSLTKADLKFEVGKEEALLHRMGSRLHKNREEIIDIIKMGLKIRSL